MLRRVLCCCLLSVAVTTSGYAANPEAEGGTPAVSVDVYAAPSFSAARIGRLNTAKGVSTLRRSGDWSEVAVPDGVVVWVYGAYVSADGRINRDNVRARPRPSTEADSPPIGKFAQGDRIELVDERGPWKRVRVYNRFTGWVPNSALARSSTPHTAVALAPSMPATSPRAATNTRPLQRQGSGDYRITSGDRLSVTVFDEPELSLEDIRVPANGVIAYPLLGRIQVAGHSERSLEQKLTNMLLEGYLREPKVSVAITGYRPFFVSGDVENPGQHPYAEGMTLEKALTLAGGPLDFGKSTTVTLAREGSSTLTVDNLSHRVFPGDVISVKSERPKEERTLTRYIYLYGEVKTPGSYEYRPGLTVEQAVALAGGFTDRASRRKIQISRYREGQDPERLKRVKLSRDVKPGDVVTVGASLF